MNILIIKLGALGDVLRTTFVARGFKEKYPSCTITWLTKENAAEILTNNSFIDHVLVWQQRDLLSSQHFDMVLSLDDEEDVCSFASTLHSNKFHGAFLENGKRKYTPGVTAWFGMGLLRPEEFGGKQEADRIKAANRKTFQEIYSAMFAIETVSSTRPVLHLSLQELQYGQNFLDTFQIPSSHTIIGINPGAGIRWELKMLSIEKTAVVCNALAAQSNVTVLLLGGLDERERNLQIKHLCLASNIIFVEPTKSIREFASIINLCDITITADSLALHISYALSKYTVAFFGPTSPWEISTFGTGLNIYHESDCLCCYKKTTDKEPSCIDRVQPDDLIQPTLAYLKQITQIRR